MATPQKPDARAKKPIPDSKKSTPRYKPSTLSAEIVIESDSDGASSVVEIPSPASAKKASKNNPTSSTVASTSSSRKENTSTKIKFPTKTSSSANAKPPRNASPPRNAGAGYNACYSSKATVPQKARPYTKKPLNAAISVSSGSEDDKPIGSVDESKSKSRNYYSEDSVSDAESRRERSTESTEPKNLQLPLQPLASFRPPTGFEPTSISLVSSSMVPEIFFPYNLKDKQIWHVTVPIRVSINTLEETSLKSLSTGSAVFQYKSADYGFVQDSEHKRTQKHLLIPSDEHNYSTSSVGVSRSLHLRQLVQLPGCTDEKRNLVNDQNSQNDLDQPQVFKKTVRQQPQGLMIRYRAFGDTGGGSDSALENKDAAVPSFKTPPRLEKSPAKKRTIADVGVVESEEMKPKKPRKDRSIIQIRNVKGIIEDEDPRYERSNETNGTSNAIVNEVANNVTNSAEGKHSEETREERAKWKEEKRRRKEERRNAKHQGSLDTDKPKKSKRKKHFEENLGEP